MSSCLCLRNQEVLGQKVMSDRRFWCLDHSAMGPMLGPMPAHASGIDDIALHFFSTRYLVLILVSIDGFRPLKVTHLLTPRMGVAAGRARAGAGGDTANWRCAGRASWRPPLGLPHRHHEQSDHRHRPSDSPRLSFSH